MKNALILIVLALAFASTQAGAATHEIKMLNNGKSGVMVFEPPFLKAAKGDTVKFIPTDAAHDVASVAVPKGAKTWKGELNKVVTTKLTEEGVYFYECNAHLPMAMVGVIQVGKPTNLEEVKAAAKVVSTKFIMNKDRFDKYLAQVQP